MRRNLRKKGRRKRKNGIKKPHACVISNIFVMTKYVPADYNSNVTIYAAKRKEKP